MIIKHLPLFVLTSLITLSCNTSPVKTSNNTAATNTASANNSGASAANSSIKSILNAHNTVRKSEGVTPLKWSNSLASYAQEWANHLKSTKNCGMQHRPQTSKYGENLFGASAFKWSDGRVEVQKIGSQKVVDSWASEEANYTHSSNSCKPGKVCGHYTQVVWKKSTEVGCAKAVCGNKSQVWVCNYNPPGNFAGQRPF